MGVILAYIVSLSASSGWLVFEFQSKNDITLRDINIRQHYSTIFIVFISLTVHLTAPRLFYMDEWIVKLFAVHILPTLLLLFALLISPLFKFDMLNLPKKKSFDE